MNKVQVVSCKIYECGDAPGGALTVHQVDDADNDHEPACTETKGKLEVSMVQGAHKVSIGTTKQLVVQGFVLHTTEVVIDCEEGN